MRRDKKETCSLPHTKLQQKSYVEKSLSIAKRGCYNSNRELKIDDGFGDYNMNLFRLRNKRKYIRNIPTAFSPEIRDLLR